MADVLNGVVDKVVYHYGLEGGNDHQIEFFVGLKSFDEVDTLTYVGPDVSPLEEEGEFFNPATVATNPLTIVDWANMVAHGLAGVMDENVTINAIIIEEINTNLEVTAIKPCNLWPGYEPAPRGNGVGLTGQYCIFQGINQAGRRSKRMVGGVSALCNGKRKAFNASILAGAGTPEFQFGDLLNRLQVIPVGGDSVDHFGITSQLDTDDELAYIVGGFSGFILHGQNKGWSKKFNY